VNTPTPSTDPVVTDVTTVSTAVKVVLAAIGVLDPAAGVALAIVAAVVALAPIATPEVEAIIAMLKGQTPAPATPLEPAIAAETAAIEQQLNTPIAPPESLTGAS
jgi:hypothetical protein